MMTIAQQTKVQALIDAAKLASIYLDQDREKLLRSIARCYSESLRKEYKEELDRNETVRRSLRAALAAFLDKPDVGRTWLALF